MEKLVACFAQGWFWPILPHKQSSNLESLMCLFYELWSLVLSIDFLLDSSQVIGWSILSPKPIESFLGCVWDCFAEMSTLVSSSSSSDQLILSSTDEGQDCFLMTGWLSMLFCTFLSSCVKYFSLCRSILLNMNLFVLFSLNVWITRVATSIWWKCLVNSTFRNIFTERNGDVFNAYFTCYLL